MVQVEPARVRTAATVLGWRQTPTDSRLYQSPADMAGRRTPTAYGTEPTKWRTDEPIHNHALRARRMDLTVADLLIPLKWSSKPTYHTTEDDGTFSGSKSLSHQS